MRCISGAVVFKTHNSFRQIWKEFGRYWKACTACKRKKERGKNGGGGGGGGGGGKNGRVGLFHFSF